MKKLIALLLAAVMCLSLAACGTQTATSEQESTQTSEQESDNGTNNLTKTKWISLYDGTVMSLNDDGCLELGENKGTWEQEGETITLKYNASASGNDLELYADILEEDGITIIRTRESGKVNGSPSNFSVSTYYPEESIDTIKAEIANTLGDTVSTDIIDLTVKKAAISFYATGPTTSSDGRTANVEEACEPAEDGGLYSCNKGHVLVCVDFVIKNNDRAKMDTGDLIVNFTLLQGDNEGFVFGYDPNNPSGSGGLNLARMPVASNGGDFITCKTSNKLISAGEELEIKWVGIANFEPDDVNGGFELVAEVKSSSGYDKFTYVIGK